MERKDEFDHWIIPEELRRKMVEVARNFRKNPTRSEAILWRALRGKKLDGLKFRRQQNIGPFIVDFYNSSYRLIVEVDGQIHERQRQADQQRQELLESLGLRFVRVPAQVVDANLPAALGLIRAALSPHPPAPSPTWGEGE